MQMTKYVSFDGMRGVAAIMVLLFHTSVRAQWPDIVPNGYLAVDMFFALSGFVIVHAYLRKLENGMSLRDFVVTRLIRLYPLFILGQVLGLVVFTLAALQGVFGYSIMPLLNAFSVGIFAIPFPIYDVGSAPPILPLNGPSWSIFWEIFVNIRGLSYCRF